MAAIAWLLYHGLAHFGYAWAMVPLAIVVAALWALESWRMRQKRRERVAAWDRWEASVLDDARRPTAITEVREELRRAYRLGTRLRVDQAHLSVILAELLDASGRADEACDVLARVRLDELDDARRAVVRHAKAVAQISASRFDEAEATLRAHRPPTEPDMDARIELLRRLVRIELGDAASAIEGVDAVAAAVPDDETGLADEAAVVRACGLDALGRADEARAVFEGLAEETVRVLARVGAPRVRRLAGASLGIAVEASSDARPSDAPDAPDASDA